MIATADSKVNNNNWIKIKNIVIENLIFTPVLLNKVTRRCPAIILAVKRTDSVNARIMFLIVSIKTIKGIRIIGVPWGIIWAKPKFQFFNQINNIKLNHNGRENLREKIICLELVKIYGNIPKKLFNNKKKNIEIKKIEFKLLNLFLKIIFISLYINIIINFIIKVKRELEIQ